MHENPRRTGEAAHRGPTLLPFSLLCDSGEAKLLPKKRGHSGGNHHISQ